MFRHASEAEYAVSSASGVRPLFTFGQYRFQDAMDEDGELHHFVLETPPGSGDPLAYEVDRDTMYEFMARYLAGEYEKETYRLERSPGHDALLDSLEMATARARAGESEFAFDDLDRGEVEVIDPDAVEMEDGDEGEGEPEPEP